LYGLGNMRNTKRISKRKIIKETLGYHFQRLFKLTKVTDSRRNIEEIVYSDPIVFDS
jgi:hypothetical protein